MIAFGSSIIMPEVYERCAKVGFQRAAEPNSQILALAATGPVARSLNLILDRAAELEDLEALVLVHQDAELLQADTAERVRRALADPQVAVVGCVGASAVEHMGWWEGRMRGNAALLQYGEQGGGRLRWVPEGQSGAETDFGEVDTLYGVLLVLSPWAVRHLRLDESVGMLHGYDFDLCRQARAAGRKVITADIPLAHHHSLDLVTQIEIWVAAHMRAAELWDVGAPAADAESTWKARARRAEADAAAARLLAASKLLYADAAARHQQQELTGLMSSRSWQLTEPLRRGNALARRLRSRSRAGSQ